MGILTAIPLLVCVMAGRDSDPRNDYDLGPNWREKQEDLYKNCK